MHPLAPILQVGWLLPEDTGTLLPSAEYVYAPARYAGALNFKSSASGCNLEMSLAHIRFND